MEHLLSLLPYLACPAAMGAMMWLMMHGNKGQTRDASMPMPADSMMTREPAEDMSMDNSLSRLHALLKNVEDQQAGITAQIIRLEKQPAELGEAAGSTGAE